ncbi:hypothetical protein C8R44DRAFT_740240 [Mycena epipterygia]|nr:hypothetical protein C8R44DRAFT_740240 [Mycena epipterygia]
MARTCVAMRGSVGMEVLPALHAPNKISTISLTLQRGARLRESSPGYPLRHFQTAILEASLLRVDVEASLMGADMVDVASSQWIYCVRSLLYSTFGIALGPIIWVNLSC